MIAYGPPTTLEQNQSNCVQHQSCCSAFFLNKNATSWIFSRYTYSDFALASLRYQHGFGFERFPQYVLVPEPVVVHKSLKVATDANVPA